MNEINDISMSYNDTEIKYDNHDKDDVVLSVRNLKTYFPIYGGMFKKVIGYVKAVDGVSFDIHKKETIGLVGESGCGKTTIANTILNLVPATEGAILYHGKKVVEANRISEFKSKIRKKIQMVFQDPDASLNPRWKVVNLIGEPLRLLEGLSSKREIRTRVLELLKTVSLKREHLDRYPHEFSGGQKQRIIIARALACNPEIIILDEPTSALDVSVQAQILNLLNDLQNQFDLSYLFITHDLTVVQHIADRIEVMYLGKFVEGGTIDEVFYNPTHPYTKALLSARPTFDPTQRRNRIILEGDVPSPINPPKGCAFMPRCYEKDKHNGCGVENPGRINLGGQHYMICRPLKDEKKSYEGWEYISD
jgi:oligopeptide/dipeptide ABC transporter ATP-binding protein